MASKSNKGEILAKFFDDGEYTALFADGAVSAACGYAAGQQAYAVYQNGEAVSVKDVEKNIKVLEMAAQTGCPVVTFYNSVGAKLAEGLDVLTVSAKLNATIAKVSGVIPQIAVVTGVCGGTSALSAANADVCVMAEDAELFFTAPFTSAAKGDKAAAAGLQILRADLLDRVHRGVGLDLTEHLVRHAGVLKRGKQLRPERLDHVRAGDDHDLRHAALAQHIRHLPDAAGAGDHDRLAPMQAAHTNVKHLLVGTVICFFQSIHKRFLPSAGGGYIRFPSLL